MNSKIITISIAITAIILAVAFQPVRSQGCAGKVCQGGPFDQCTECGSACPPTCDEPTMEGKACIAMCVSNVCRCTQGTVRGPGGQCVNPSQCPPKSG